MSTLYETVKLRRRLAMELLILVTLLGTTIVVLYDMARTMDRNLEDARVNGQLQALAVTAALDRYRGLPEIWSKEPNIIQSIEKRDTEALQARGFQLTYLSGAWGVGFFDSQGQMIAFSARGGEQPPFNQLPSELVEAVKQQRLGRTFKREEGAPLYAFTSGIVGGGSVQVWVELTALQEQWGLLPHPVGIFDANRKVLLSNNLELVDQFLPADPNQQMIDLRLPAYDWTLFAEGSAIARPSYTLMALSLSVGFILWGLLSRLFRRQMADIAAQRTQQAAALRLERLVKRRTRDLEQAQQAQIQTAKLAAVGQMSTTLTHEFNQPIATIQTYAENAKRFIEMDQSDVARQNLDHILSQTERMGLLSRTLLTFARRPGVEMQWLDWHQSLNEALILLKPRIDQAQAVVQVTGLDQRIWAEPIRLTQVWLNLVGNALDAMAQQSDARIQIHARLHQGQFAIDIQDTGPGVDPGLRQELFEPFVTSKPAGSGLGLGLALARDLMRQFDGDLALISTSDSTDAGATFRLSFTHQSNEP